MQCRALKRALSYVERQRKTNGRIEVGYAQITTHYHVSLENRDVIGLLAAGRTWKRTTTCRIPHDFVQMKRTCKICQSRALCIIKKILFCTGSGTTTFKALQNTHYFEKSIYVTLSTLIKVCCRTSLNEIAY
eukprot:m.306364 g.306364  ORF g.306364 m.306364 type:complete len:132 (+) comp16456_c0_seq2:2267-2662(+)